MAEDYVVHHQRTLYESRNPTRRWLHTSRREWISSAVRNWSSHGGRALKIGPGFCVYIPLLQEMCSDVYVWDCERAFLRSIERRYAGDPRVKVLVDDITQSTLPPEHFDLVVCTEVLEHIADSRSALRHIARIMKPNGILVLSTPQRYSSLELTAKLALSPWLMWLTRAIYREPVIEMGHINLMTDVELQTQIAEAHLKIVDRYKSGLYFPIVAELLGAAGKHSRRT